MRASVRETLYPVCVSPPRRRGGGAFFASPDSLDVDSVFMLFMEKTYFGVLDAGSQTPRLLIRGIKAS